MQTVTPFLWFDGKAEEAATLYTGLFPGSAILETRRGAGSGSGVDGGVMSVTFRLGEQDYIAFNGGPHFTFSPAVSLFVRCDTQAEIDHYWNTLSEGGETQRCGWLKDRFGLSWQIVPRVLGDMLQDTDRAASRRAFEAMMGMVKLEIAELEKAHAGRDGWPSTDDGPRGPC